MAAWDEESVWSADESVAPGLIGSGAEVADLEEQPRLAETAYLPSRRFQAGDASTDLQLGRLPDGRSALLSYSSLELLVAACGQNQPWVAVRLADPGGIDQLASLSGADMVLWDVAVPDDE